MKLAYGASFEREHLFTLLDLFLSLLRPAALHAASGNLHEIVKKASWRTPLAVRYIPR
jgi:hypothetical protein